MVPDGMDSALKLNEMWIHKLKYEVGSLALSENGYLGATSLDNCAYIINRSGMLTNKHCGELTMKHVSFCCSKFGFANRDGYVYIYDTSTGVWKKIKVGETYGATITLLEDGFLVGWAKLAYVDFNGNKRWSMNTDYISDNPAVYNGFAYVPMIDGTYGELGILSIIRLSDGTKLSSTIYNELVFTAKTCDKYLAVGTEKNLYLYDISEPTTPRMVWSLNVGVSTVDFSQNCRYLITNRYEEGRIHFLDMQTGKQLQEKTFERMASSVAWRRNRIAVGLTNGKIYMFKVSTNSSAEDRRLTVRDLLFKSRKDDLGQFEVE